MFHENNKRVGQTADMSILTRRYTDKAIEFLETHRSKPFFLYVAHTMVHSVIGASPKFKGRSKGGLYGDTIEELDFETGRLLDALDRLNLSDNTLVIFTSDNGPWNNMKKGLLRRQPGEITWGDSGPLREGKGSTYEGGLRVPCIARWPGHIPENRTSDVIFATIDFLPTIVRLAGADVPADRTIDGVDQTDLLLGKSESGNRDDYFYFCRGELHAVRKGPWKLFLPDRKKFHGYVDDKGTRGIELYHLGHDISESNDLSKEHPEQVKRLLEYAHRLPLPKRPYNDRIGLPRKRPPQPKVDSIKDDQP